MHSVYEAPKAEFCSFDVADVITTSTGIPTTTTPVTTTEPEGVDSRDPGILHEVL